MRTSIRERDDHAGVAADDRPAPLDAAARQVAGDQRRGDVARPRRDRPAPPAQRRPPCRDIGRLPADCHSGPRRSIGVRRDRPGDRDDDIEMRVAEYADPPGTTATATPVTATAGMIMRTRYFFELKAHDHQSVV